MIKLGQRALSTRDVMRCHDTRSGKIRCVSLDPTGLAKMWQYPCKTFCSVYIKAATLIIKNVRSFFEHPRNRFFLNENYLAMSIAIVSHRECQWIVRSMFCHCPYWWIRGSAIIMLPMWTLSFTDMGGDKTRAANAPLMLTMLNRC